jgi:hypothetical protein
MMVGNEAAEKEQVFADRLISWQNLRTRSKMRWMMYNCGYQGLELR